MSKPAPVRGAGQPGERRRLFTGATRRAVEVLFPTCFHPSCDEPATESDIHHPKRVADGGLTTQDNGVPGCAFHHRWLHRRE